MKCQKDWVNIYVLTVNHFVALFFKGSMRLLLRVLDNFLTFLLQFFFFFCTSKIPLVFIDFYFTVKVAFCRSPLSKSLAFLILVIWSD